MPKTLQSRVAEKEKISEENLLNFYKFEPSTKGNGWHVTVLDRDTESYPDLPDYFDGTPIIDCEGTFAGCSKLEIPPRLPQTGKYFDVCFAQCTSLHTLPELPHRKRGIQVDSMFADCLGLAPVLDQAVTEDTKIIVANITQDGLVTDIREITVGELEDQFQTDDYPALSTKDVCDVLDSQTTVGIIEVGETTVVVDEVFAHEQTVCILASESFSGGQNFANLTTLNIDPFKLSKEFDTQDYGMLRLCNQVGYAIGPDKGLKAFLTVDQNATFARSGVVTLFNRVEDKDIQVSNDRFPR